MDSHSHKYEDTITFLYSLQKHGIKLGLSNTNHLMQILGDPHRSFRSIHIAGTNGKGSTSSIIAAILQEAGLKAGLFTSPHLISFTERIRINNQQISESDVIKLASAVRECIKARDLNPTFFEFVTAMAFYYFAKNKVEWAVIETGMGGRLDATNVVQPEIGIITNISLDHCEFLGKTIPDITYEKAGIIKPGVPLITASTEPVVIEQLSEKAQSLGCEIHIYDRDFSGDLIHMDDKCITFNYHGYSTYENLSLPLTGKYQLYNACLAIRAIEILNKNGLHLPNSSMSKGLQNVSMEGRLEWVSESPPILLDGAHNPGAATALAASVKELFPDKKIILITGVMSDKDIKEILKPLMGISESVILTKAAYERAASSERLRNIIMSVKDPNKSSNPESIVSTESIPEALHLAKSLCTENSIILITGSFYTAGEAKELLGYKSVLSRLRE